MESSPENLPAIAALSPSVVSFLNTTFHPKHDLNLSESTRLVTELDSHSSQLTHRLTDLTRRLEASLLSHASSSNRITDAFHHIHRQLQDLKSKSSSFASTSGSLLLFLSLHQLIKNFNFSKMSLIFLSCRWRRSRGNGGR